MCSVHSSISLSVRTARTALCSLIYEIQLQNPDACKLVQMYSMHTHETMGKAADGTQYRRVSAVGNTVISNLDMRTNTRDHMAWIAHSEHVTCVGGLVWLDPRRRLENRGMVAGM